MAHALRMDPLAMDPLAMDPLAMDDMGLEGLLDGVARRDRKSVV